MEDCKEFRISNPLEMQCKKQFLGLAKNFAHKTRNRRFLSGVVLVFCISLIHPVFALQLQLSRSNLSNQIDQPVIAAIYRDSTDFLWIGTQEGLYRFDGAKLTVFNSDGNNENWIPSSDIRGISQTKDGTLLVATYGGGLLTFDKSSGRFISNRTLASTDESQIIRLYVSNKGNIWLSTKDKIMLYDRKFDTVIRWPASQQIADAIGRPYTFLENDSGDLFVGSNLGLTKLSTRDRTAVRYDLSSLSTQKYFGVTALELDGDGNIIVGTDKGDIAVLEMEGGRVLSHANLDSENGRLVSDFVLFESRLLIATDNGLFASANDLSSFKNISLQGEGLSSSDIYNLHVDGNRVWVGTYNGLDILSLAPFELFNSREGNVHDDILTFEQDDYSRIWIGTYGGLYLYDNSSGSHLRFESKYGSVTLLDQRITAIAALKSKVWLGFFQGGVELIDLLNGQTYIPEIENSHEMFVMDIYIDKDNDDVWIATYKHGLFKISSEKTYYYYDSGALPERSISLVFDAGETLLLVSTSSRIYEYNENTNRFSLLPFDFGLSPNKIVVFSVAEDRDGNIWLGTKDHGLFRWTKSNQISRDFRLDHFGKSTALEYSTIYGIEPDFKGNLWCSTQNGIVKLDPNGQLIKRFTIADGLQGNDFSFGASFTSREGLIYFGGINGYNRFDPDQIDTDSAPSPMRLTGIHLPQRDERNLGSVADLKSLQLTHNDHFVTFEFSVLDFIDSDRNQFRYMLRNFDPDWIDNGNRNTATYTNLPAGEYVFRAQGANSAGVWNRDGITLRVRVLPPPWYTAWAYSLYVVAFILSGWVAHRIYHSYAVDRKSAQLAQAMFDAETRADEDMQEQLELQDELVQAAYQHNMTTLELVSDCLARRSIGQPEDVKRQLTESSIKRIAALSTLEDCLSYQAGGPVADLHRYTEGILARLLLSSPVNPETIVSINEVSSIPLPAELASPLSIVIYELLENSVQHAFESKSPANYIHIKMKHVTTYGSSGGHLDLSIRDSGIGIPASVEELGPESSGIAIVQSIVSELGGNLEFSGISGTTVSITIPVPGNWSS